MTPTQIAIQMRLLRRLLELEFSDDLRNQPAPEGCIPSTGHCAIVANLCTSLWDMDLRSTTIQGQSHWYSRYYYDVDGCEHFIDIDLTGDQFGLPPVQISEPLVDLYPESRRRGFWEIDENTEKRTRNLLRRLGRFTPEESPEEPV